MQSDHPHNQYKSFATPPRVLCFSGLDPSGGAGIQADIETLLAIGCIPASIVTCVTAQNSAELKSWQPIPTSMLKQQAQLIFDETPIAAIKIGMLGTIEIIEVIAKIISDQPNIPIILDPILKSGRGQSLSQAPLVDALLQALIPSAHLITPNALEIRQLCPNATNVTMAVDDLLASGCQNVCLTGGHIKTEAVHNKAWNTDHCIYDQVWPRLKGQYHGTGCTFASACAGYIAHGINTAHALALADEFTWNSINQALPTNRPQHVPNRQHQQSFKTTHQELINP